MNHGDYTGPIDIHHECWELLPWLANERLSAKDAARAEAHLRDCAACREELTVQRQLRAAIREQDAVVLAPQNSLLKLMQRIDVQEESDAQLELVRSVTTASEHAPASTPRRRPHWLAVAAVLQAVAIAGLLGAVWLQSQEALQAPRYVTMSSGAPATHGPVIRVVFADDTTLEDVNRALRVIDAQIIAGPSDAGVYTLGLSTSYADNASVDAALLSLRASERVVFAESAVAGPEK
jgi:Putative zinc-finger